MAHWEYWVSRFQTTPSMATDATTLHQNLITHMNEMDADGWELINGSEHMEGVHTPFS